MHLLINNRHRTVEYDTYRDPVGPLSASAQFLYGAISYFVTGLTNVPTDIVHELVSAGRAMGSSHGHSNPRARWHVRRHHNEDEIESDESSEERSTAQPELSGDRSASSSLVSSDGINPSFGGETLANDRRQSIPLEKLPTMSSEIAPSKPKGLFTEALAHGNRMSMKLINLVIWLPTDLSLSLSKGFHNAPNLYHDPMIKSTPMVTGIRSGFRAAGKVSFFESSYQSLC